VSIGPGLESISKRWLNRGVDRPFSNEYKERYARICLAEVVDRRYYFLRYRAGEKKDRNRFPDFIPTCRSFDVGLEVTGSESDKEGQLGAAMAYDYGLSPTAAEMNAVRIKKFSTMKAHFEQDPATGFVSPVKDDKKDPGINSIGSIDGPLAVTRALNSIITKTGILNNSSRNDVDVFPINELFLRAEGIWGYFAARQIKEVLVKAKWGQHNKDFAKIYFFCGAELFMVEIGSPEQIRWWEISNDKLTLIKKKAHPFGNSKFR